MGAIRRLGKIVALAAVYVATARLGLALATVERSVTLVWPPTGIALAALLVLGVDLWPGVALGALVVNALTPGVPILSACGMAAGNTLEAVVGATILRRSGFDPGLARIRDVGRLVAAATISTAISATLGVASLKLGGVIPLSAVARAHPIWWVGDLMGDLVVAPVILVWTARPRPAWRTRATIEGAGMGALVILTAAVAFHPPPPDASPWYPQPHVIFPFVVWAAFRFGSRGAAASTFAVSAVAVWGTAQGRGPFAAATLGESLIPLSAFMTAVALTSLLLGAATAERRHALFLRDDFIAIASHEMNTPLTPLKLLVQRLLRAADHEGGPTVEPADVRRMLHLADRQIDRLAALVARLLDLARIQAGQLTLEPSETDLAALTAETLDGLREQSAEAGCEISLRSSPPVLGRWDRARLQQVIANVVINAIKYGQGRPIDVTVDGDGHRARVAVRDHGMGMTPDEMARIFHRFERAQRVRGTAGLGLGLYVARTIAEAHAGRITVESRRGEGSTFTLELPLAPPSVLTGRHVRAKP